MPLANFLKRNSKLLAGALFIALAIFVAAPNPSPAAATPQQQDQMPGFKRIKIGDLEVTALLDGLGVFDLHWLKGNKATIDGVVRTLETDPHLLDGVVTGFLVNTGKRLILVDAGAGTWFGEPPGRLAASLRSAGYAPEGVGLVLVTHLHSDHIGGLTTKDGQRVFPNAEVYVAKAESDYWLSPEHAANAPKDTQPFFQSAQAVAAPYIKAGKWHTFIASEAIVDGMRLVPLPGHTPGHTGYEFSSKGQKILFWGDTIHAQRVQLQHPEVTVVFDIDPPAAAATRNHLLPRIARENVVIAGPHMSPSLGRLRKEASGYSWSPVASTDVLAGTAPPLGGAKDLRGAETFASISDPSERSRALFIEAGRVLQHPRCLNCHPAGERPTQGNDSHPHSPLVIRGPDDKGALGMRCATCHQNSNYEASRVPGHPLWHVAPQSMAWQTKSLAQICEQIKDPKRNGGKTLAAIHEHMANDSLVGWGWMPGGGREPAPGTQAQLGALIAAWIESGAACPAR